MTRCIFPNCNKKATIGCVCHLGSGWWCEKHLENHLKATKMGLQQNKQDVTN